MPEVPWVQATRWEDGGELDERGEKGQRMHADAGTGPEWMVLDWYSRRERAMPGGSE